MAFIIRSYCEMPLVSLYLLDSIPHLSRFQLLYEANCCEGEAHGLWMHCLPATNQFAPFVAGNVKVLSVVFRSIHTQEPRAFSGLSGNKISPFRMSCAAWA